MMSDLQVSFRRLFVIVGPVVLVVAVIVWVLLPPYVKATLRMGDLHMCLLAFACVATWLFVTLPRLRHYYKLWSLRGVGIRLNKGADEQVLYTVADGIRHLMRHSFACDGGVLPRTPEEFDDRVRADLVPYVLRAPDLKSFDTKTLNVICKATSGIIHEALAEMKGKPPGNETEFLKAVSALNLRSILGDTVGGSLDDKSIDTVCREIRNHLTSLYEWSGNRLPEFDEDVRSARLRSGLELLGIRDLPEDAGIAAEACVRMFRKMVSHFTGSGGQLTAFDHWHGMLCDSIRHCDSYFATALGSPAYWAGDGSFAATRFFSLVDEIGERSKQLEDKPKKLDAIRVFIADTSKMCDEKEERAWLKLVKKHGQNNCRIILRDLESLKATIPHACQTLTRFSAGGFHWALVARGEPIPRDEKGGKRHYIQLELEISQGILTSDFTDIERELKTGCEWILAPNGRPSRGGDECGASHLRCQWSNCSER